MKRLLDVNALLAWGLDAHPHHDRTRRWLARLRGGDTTLCTTPITELGFLRVAAQPAYARQLADGRRILDSMRRAPGFAHAFLPDDVPGDRLPAWVQTPAQTTDGHLLALAAKHGAKLATLDTGIPGALLIALTNKTAQSPFVPPPGTPSRARRRRHPGRVPREHPRPRQPALDFGVGRSGFSASFVRCRYSGVTPLRAPVSLPACPPAHRHRPPNFASTLRAG